MYKPEDSADWVHRVTNMWEVGHPFPSLCLWQTVTWCKRPLDIDWLRSNPRQAQACPDPRAPRCDVMSGRAVRWVIRSVSPAPAHPPPPPLPPSFVWKPNVCQASLQLCWCLWFPSFQTNTQWVKHWWTHQNGGQCLLKALKACLCDGLEKLSMWFCTPSYDRWSFRHRRHKVTHPPITCEWMNVSKSRDLAGGHSEEGLQRWPQHQQDNYTHCSPPSWRQGSALGQRKKRKRKMKSGRCQGNDSTVVTTLRC